VAAKLPSTLIYIVYFLLTAAWFIWQMINGQNLLNPTLWLPVVGWLLGGFIGYWLLILDQVLDIYYAHPETQLAQYVRYYLNKGHYRWIVKVLKGRRHDQPRLTFRSAVFQVLWLGLAIFALTSTSSLLGKAVVMGLGLHLLLNEWEDYLANPETLRSWLFWQVKREVSFKEQRYFLIAMTVFFLLFTINIIG
jgi:hypothetical protein